jgi:predicted dienelactone hydrolase
MAMLRHVAAPIAALLTACVTRTGAPRGLQVREIPTVRQSDAGQPIIQLPAPTGSHRVGRMSFYAVDSTRSEKMKDDPNDRRELVFHVWYPTDDSAGVLASYIEVWPQDTIFQRTYRFNIDALPRVRAHALAKAGVSSAAPRYPVILFSHGLGTVSRLYTSFLENLASHGYIVIGVDHPYFGSAFRLPDGRTVGTRSSPADRQRDVITQAEDLSFVVTVLEGLQDSRPATRLAGRLDLRSLGVFGHSRGGFASPHACRIDRRFKACVNLDGYSMTPAVMDSGIVQPFMLVEESAPWDPPPTDSELAASHMTRAEAAAEAAQASAQFEATFSRMSGGAYLMMSPGAVHMSFSDVALISPQRFPAARQEFRRTIEITNAYLLAFFDKYLRGQSAPLLESRSLAYPEVSLTVYLPGKDKRVFGGATTR